MRPMRLCIVLSFLLLSSLPALAQINETEAKASYMLAEENYGKGNYPVALTFLKNAKTSLGGANCKILYLQIQIESELAKTRKNYRDSLLNTIAAFQAAPDVKDFNEDKVLEVVKMKLELAQKLTEEKALLAEQKAAEEAKNEKTFKDWRFTAGLNLGLTVKEAEKMYPVFFRKTKTEMSQDYPGLEMISSKPVSYNTFTVIASVFIKNGKIVGNRIVQEYEEGDSKKNNYEAFKKSMLNERDNNNKLFGFEPISLPSADGLGFVWKKKGKTFTRDWTKIIRKGDGFYGAYVSDIVDESY
ncbi:MAG: hypothetical protein IM598_08725 [Chitinophagaceae bacterium]|nr:hypothetical protein [Chitinophagaceae bacterium]MCA6453929.1 hypothetical protein [Chitinophagaceae bacterium]MCA6459299.1 hypothetical protein [Chitinophagaceae bacterium]MCA6464897.1 hypothetical protein [Chitinophagaceae bacterium]